MVLSEKKTIILRENILNEHIIMYDAVIWYSTKIGSKGEVDKKYQ